jgi:hypothetical protein
MALLFQQKHWSVRLNELRSCNVILQKEDPEKYVPLTPEVFYRARIFLERWNAADVTEISIDEDGGVLEILICNSRILVELHNEADMCCLYHVYTATRKVYPFLTAEQLVQNVWSFLAEHEQ